MITGHYRKLAELRARLLTRSAVYADVDAQAYERHSAKVDMEMLRRQSITPLESAVAEDEALILELEGMLERLARSLHQSSDRSLVITKLEEAADRLNRSLGDP